MLHRCSWITLLIGLLTTPSHADLVYYVADGNDVSPNLWENHLIKYSNGTITAELIQDPTITPPNHVYGFPSDFQRVGSAVYGIDTARHSLYTIDMNTGYVTPVGTNGLAGMSGLAYDGSTMFLSHKDNTNLYSINLATASPTFLFSSTEFSDVRGLAYNSADGHLYAHSRGTGSLLKIDPNTQSVTPLYTLDGPVGTDYYFSELQFHGGQLYGTWVNGTAAANTEVQLRRIDLNTGLMTDIGSLISGVSAHSLLIVSIPEPSMVPLFCAATASVIGMVVVRTRHDNGTA